MKKKIITDINYLKQKSEEISPDELNPIIKDLEDSLDTSKGCGLSAIQIGIKKAVAIIRLPKCELNLFNAKIIKKENPFRFKQEGCLSLPYVYVDTRRYYDVVIENGDNKQYALIGLEAVAVEHELAHCKGRTILDDKWKKRR